MVPLACCSAGDAHGANGHGGRLDVVLLVLVVVSAYERGWFLEVCFLKIIFIRLVELEKISNFFFRLLLQISGKAALHPSTRLV